LEVLIEVGFDRLTMDAVAARARSSKATLYRHWPSKAELVTESVRALRTAPPVDQPRGESLRGDLLDFLSHINDHASQDQVCMMRGLISACSTDAALAVAVRQQLIETKRQTLLQILQTWRDRGEIADDLDLPFLVDVMPSLITYRFLVTHDPVDQEFLIRMVDEIALPLLTQPDLDR
jgi:AcrR family transcriptional regulator